jgi:uridine kinase
MFRLPLRRASVGHVQVFSLDDVFESATTDGGSEAALAEASRLHGTELGQRVIRPLARRCARATGSMTTPVVGVVGGPGAGKTTFARDLCSAAHELFGLSTLLMSLEDFYYPPDVLAGRGLAWRALPGSHNLRRLITILSDVISRMPSRTEVPRFDMETGSAAKPETVDLPVDLCVIEGWLVGHDKGEYAAVSDKLDLLVYLDLPVEELRRSRLGREADTRAASFGQRGMAADVVAAFWAEALEPGVRDWVQPIRDRSDVIVRFDGDRRILSIDVAANVG